MSSALMANSLHDIITIFVDVNLPHHITHVITSPIFNNRKKFYSFFLLRRIELKITIVDTIFTKRGVDDEKKICCSGDKTLLNISDRLFQLKNLNYSLK